MAAMLPDAIWYVEITWKCQSYLRAPQHTIELRIRCTLTTYREISDERSPACICAALLLILYNVTAAKEAVQPASILRRQINPTSKAEIANHAQQHCDCEPNHNPSVP